VTIGDVQSCDVPASQRGLMIC